MSNVPPFDEAPGDSSPEALQALREQALQGWRVWRPEAIEAACDAAACAHAHVPADATAPAALRAEISNWRARAALMRGQADALAHLELAHAASAEAGDALGQAVSANLALVLCLLDIGAMDQVQLWLGRAQALAATSAANLDAAVETEPGAASSDAAFWLRLGLLAGAVLSGAPAAVPAGAAEHWLHAQLGPLGVALSPDERLIAAQVLVNHHFVQQRYERFDELAACVELPALFERASPLMRARWLYTVGFAHYQIGGHERAEQAWQQAMALAEAHELPAVSLLVSLARVRLLVDRRRIDEAHEVVEAIRPQWGAGRTRQLIEWQQMRARVQLMRGQPALALATLGEALRLAESAGLSAPEQASFLTDEAQVLAALGRDDEACARLAELAASHTGRDAQVYHCLHQLLRAWQWRRRDEAAGRLALIDALARAQAVRYTMFLRLLPGRAAQVCALALQWQIEPVFVREVIRARALPAPPQADGHWPWPLGLRLLGGFEWRLDGAVPPRRGKTAHKPLELLQLLACQRGLALGMGEAERALWPESLEAGEGAAASIRKNLEMAVQRLRRLLGDDSLVQVREGRVALDADRVSSDVLQRRRLIEALEALAVQAPTAEAATRDAQQSEARRLIAAVWALSLGDLLPGVADSPWLLAERERCRRELVRATLAAAALLERFGDARAECEWLETTWRIEPLAELVAQRLMQAHARAGRRADAARIHEDLRLSLATQGLRPSAETEALWREIVNAGRGEG